jgi:D-alanyl-D-alanine carboxypeptidase
MLNLYNKESIIIGVLALALLATSFTKMVAVHSSQPILSLAKEGEHVRAPDPFLSVDITAQAVLVWDIKNNVPLYARNENVQLPLASLSKIMTALIAVEEIESKRMITITKDAILQEGDHGLIVGEKWRLKDLIDLTLLTSSNDGAHALASVFGEERFNGEQSPTTPFIQKMNQKTWEIGMYQTFFINESGLDVGLEVSGTYGSARDIVSLMEYILQRYPDLMNATPRALLTTYSLDDTEHNLENTNDIVETLPGMIVSKTGFTDLAGGNLAIAFDAGPARPLITVVLGSTEEDRLTDIEQLLWASLRFIAR